ncbi:MAG TPA: hypothetical protein VGH67_19815 [Solirubrobacteraceae bacterium]
MIEMHMPLALSRNRAVLLAATVALLVGGALVVGNATGAGARPVAHLALVRSQPVTVSGRGFRPHVRIALRLVAHTTLSRRPLAGRNGTFTVTFPTVIDRCAGWSVTATQSGRAPVMLRSPAKPECAPLRAP